MLDLHHGSIDTNWEGVVMGLAMDASLTTAAMRVREAQAIGGRGCRCEGEEAKYRTLGANPLVL